ncbi:MAG: S1 RNA-binding domain-containing protein [Caldilineae bacterium]|nr:MAG: S1 RNA-binding domain-containing protein [Caldilineae bacterium]
MSAVKQGQEKPKIKVIPPKKVVKKLAVGQEVTGRVKRLADFGAFIDIGVGTDALVHVSEMSQKRIGKPKDVLSVGDEVKAWIKALDKDHNRISLTLLPPGTRTIRDLKVGEVVKGTVTRITDFGAFVDFGVGYEGMVHVKEMAHGYVKHPSDVVEVGQEVEAEILKINRRRGQIDLSMRAVMPEPEPEPRPEPEEPDELAEPEDEPVPTAFEFALQKAQQRAQRSKKRRKRQWFEEEEDDLDDVLARTLSYADES